MSIWQFQAAVGGYIKANAPEDTQGISTEAAAHLAEFIDAPPVWH